MEEPISLAKCFLVSPKMLILYIVIGFKVKLLTHVRDNNDVLIPKLFINLLTKLIKLLSELYICIEPSRVTEPSLSNIPLINSYFIALLQYLILFLLKFFKNFAASIESI